MKFLSSIELAIVLLSLIILVSIIGTIIPQNWPEDEYIRKYGDTFASLLKKLQIDNIFHSYWYSLLLGLFCINLISCSVERYKPLIKLFRPPTSAVESITLSQQPFYEEIQLGKGVKDVELGIKKAFAPSFYRLKFSNSEKGVYYFERAKIGRLGPLITHASIIIILFGGIIVGLLGFKTYVKIPVGDIINVPRSDFQLKVEDFGLKFYQNGTPKEYTSVLTIMENGTAMLTQAIEVNHPLKYKGIKFYQSGYGILNKPDNQPIKYYTELQLGSDPGIFIIWIGSGFMIIGMFMSFYLTYKRIWIRFCIRDNQGILEVGAKSYKDRAGFDKEFSRLKLAFGNKRKIKK